MSTKNIKVLIVELGQNANNKGEKNIARSLMAAEMEVVFIRAQHIPDQIVNAYIQEDVDIIGFSILADIYKNSLPVIMKSLKKSGINNITAFVIGEIPEIEHQKFKKIGVSKIFKPKTPSKNIATFIRHKYYE